MIHVAGPPGAGKTTLIERLLEKDLGLAICVRGERDAGRRRKAESAPKGHAELRRYRKSGASSVALYRFPTAEAEAFYDTRVMEDYSEAVFIEGDCPVEFVDLTVFVAPAPRPGESLLRRVLRDNTAKHRASIEKYAAAFETRESLAEYLMQELGGPMASMALGRPEVMDEVLSAMKKGLERARRSPPPKATEHWALGSRWEGLERAQLVVVNPRPEDDPQTAQELCAEIPRLRKDRDVFDDVIGLSGNRVPITAVVADLTKRTGPGLRKCIAKVRRTVRSVLE